MSIFKKNYFLFIIVISLVALNANFVLAQTIKLKFSDINAQNSPAGVFCEKFSETISKHTNGDVLVETYYGGTLTGNDIEGTQTGIADFSQHDVSEITDLCPLLSILEAPYMYDNDEQLYEITLPDSPIMEKINLELKGSGVRLVSTYSWGNQNLLTTKKPVYSEADLKGLKIRVLPSKIFMATMEEMGAIPTPMSWGEVITSLVTGVIDGTGMPFAYIVSGGLHEVCKYIVLTKHNPTLSGVFMNENSWLKLSEEQQKVIGLAGDVARRHLAEYMRENEEIYRKQIVEKGCIIIEEDKIDFNKEKIREAVFSQYVDVWGDTYREILDLLGK